MRKRSEAKARPQRRVQEDLPEREYQIAVPHDVINEQVILAAMLVDEETCDRLLPLIPTDAFHMKEHRVIREVIGEARRKNLACDPATLSRLSPDADIRILEGLPTSRPNVTENLDFHVDMLLWDCRRAKAARGPISSLLDALQNPKESRERLRVLAKQVGEVFEGEDGQYLRDSKVVASQVMMRIRKRISGEAYYPYGIHGLDHYEDGSRRLRPGASPQTITLVSALSGSGKSTLMAHLANASARLKRKVLFGAWEEDAPVTLESLAVFHLGWSRSRVLDGKSNTVRTEGGDDWAPMTHEDLVVLEETMDKIGRWVTFFDNPFQHTRTPTARRITNDDHIDIIHDHLAKSGCDVFFADLLHRCFIDDTPRDEKLALQRLLTVMQDQKVHMIAAHQQRAKDIEARVDKRPTREGIIGAGAWLDVPWTILAPHIPAKWKNVPDTTLELLILKQRNGPWPIGIEFDWDPDTGQIRGGRSIDIKNATETSEIFGAPSQRPSQKSRAAKLGFGARRR